LAVLFIPAGRLDWLAGWTFLCSFLVAVGIIAIWARRNDPELLEERQTASQAQNIKRWDRILMAVYTVLLLLLIVISGVDAVRIGWSRIPVILRIMGWLGLGVAFWIVWRVMAENTYLSEHVRIQEERGHQVITTGPYQHVRHPMYVGIIIAMLGVPLALGSWWALVPAVLIVILFIIRTALEDRTLIAELPGYKEYAKQVRYKLIPRVW
jgi:protein-S-isoprenylcysteine O-methyltransferase Ste14